MGLLMERSETATEIVYQYKPKTFYVWWWGLFVLILVGTVLKLTKVGDTVEKLFVAFLIVWIFTGALSTIPFTTALNRGRGKGIQIQGSVWKFIFGRGTMIYRIKK